MVQGTKRPKLFWVSAGAPLVSVILSTLLVFAFKAQHHGISVVSCLLGSHLSNKIKIKLKTALHINCLLFIGLNVHHAIFSVTDWETARRVKSSFVEHAEISWKPPGTSNENRTHHWHYFPHCKYRFSNLYAIITYSILIILILTNFYWFKLCTKQEGIAVGRTFAALKNYQVDGNKEMIAIGVMNIVGSSTSCYITTGAISTSYAFLRSSNNSRR